MVLGGVVLKIWPHTSGLSFRDTLFTRDPPKFQIALPQKPKGVATSNFQIFHLS